MSCILLYFSWYFTLVYFVHKFFEEVCYSTYCFLISIVVIDNVGNKLDFFFTSDPTVLMCINQFNLKRNIESVWSNRFFWRPSCSVFKVVLHAHCYTPSVRLNCRVLMTSKIKIKSPFNFYTNDSFWYL